MALTAGEFAILSAFVQHPDRVLSRDFLLEKTRGREAAPFDRTIDVQVGRLRKKLEVNADDPQIIKSVRGAGYILVAPVTSSVTLHGVPRRCRLIDCRAVSTRPTSFAACSRPIPMR